MMGGFDTAEILYILLVWVLVYAGDICLMDDDPRKLTQAIPIMLHVCQMV